MKKVKAMKESELKARIERLPRIKLANLPTPLESMPRLSKRLGGPKLWIKRDDLTGLVVGGNKVRKLEFEMAEALEKKVDVIVSGGVVQSNHAFATLAATRKLGMKAVLLLRGKKPRDYDGNLFLDNVFGAEIEFIRDNREQAAKRTKKIVEKLKSEGHSPHIVPFSSPLGSVGYVNALLELLLQAKNIGIKIDYIVHAAGSGGTQAGLVVGNKALKAGIDIIGISPEPDEGGFLVNTTEKIADECAQLLGLGLPIERKDITILYDYVGEGYGIVTKEITETIRRIAETEGVLLDPVYTVKAMKGLMGLIEQGRFDKRKNIVFLHTGGIPAIFAHKKHFQQ